MNIVLVNPRLNTWSPAVYFPLGLGYIAAVLEQAGHHIRIYDLNSQKISNEKLGEKLASADIVGISGMLTEYKEVLRLSDVVKEYNKKAKIILGGGLATTQTHRVLQSSKIDYTVIDEGEDTIVDLASAIDNDGDIGSVKSIAYKNNNEVIFTPKRERIENLDRIPFPARHLFDMKHYTSNHFRNFGINIPKVNSVTMITSRGCPYSCTFCCKDVWGFKWRGRSAENIVAEIKQLKEDYGFNSFVLNDDTFVLKKQRVFEFCHRVKELGIHWYCNGRVNLMTKELLQTMHDAGCVGIGYGLESGNQRILDSIKKGIKLEQVRKVARWTKEEGIHATGYFMIGILGDSRATIEDTINFAREIDLDFYAFACTIPFVGTELYKSAQERGLVTDNELEDWSVRPIANLTEDCSIEDLERFNRAVFREFTVEKRYGKHYLLNPLMWAYGIRTFFFLLNKRSVARLLKKSWSVVVAK